MTATKRKWKSADDRNLVARLIGYIVSDTGCAALDHSHRYLKNILYYVEQNFGSGSESIEIGTVNGVTYYRVMLSGSYFIDTRP